MIGEPTVPEEGNRAMTKVRVVAQRHFGPIGSAIARTLGLLGFAANQEPTATTRIGEGSYDDLLSAVAFKRLADQVMSRTDAVASGEQSVIAARLYLDALRLAGRARSSQTDDAGKTSISGPSILAAIPAFPNSGTAADLVDRMLRYSVVDLVALPAEECRTYAVELRSVTEAVTNALSRDLNQTALRVLSRPIRLAVTLTVLLALVGQLAMVAYWWEKRSNLALGKTWRASSALAACQPVELGGCPTRPGIYFHTKNDDNPWIEYDLAKPTKFSSIAVENAPDGHSDRAVPLIVEVSDDQTTWQEVARVTTDFKEWRTSFPDVTARYVRLRVPRVSYLHLARVSINK